MLRICIAVLSLCFVSGGLGHSQQSASAWDNDQLKQKDHPPKLLKSVDADYPLKAKAKGISGRCSVKLIVDLTGKPQNIQIVRCTDSVFEKSSMEAISNYRFAPATNQDGTPVAASITIVVDFRSDSEQPAMPVRVSFRTPPGVTSTAPDGAGVYPLTNLVNPPKFSAFVDDGYTQAAFRAPGSGICDVVFTIDREGKASSIDTLRCDKNYMEEPAAQSLLKSRYKPASLNGNSVPVKVMMHLELGETAAREIDKPIP